MKEWYLYCSRVKWPCTSHEKIISRKQNLKNFFPGKPTSKFKHTEANFRKKKTVSKQEAKGITEQWKDTWKEKRCGSERTQSKFIQKWKYRKLILICQFTLEEQQAKVCLYQDVKTDTQEQNKNNLHEENYKNLIKVKKKKQINRELSPVSYTHMTLPTTSRV